MRAITLCYHDILCDGDARRSGFQSPGAETYKLPLATFRSHLRAIERGGRSEAYAVRLTFDDGGSGAMCAAEALEQAGLRGHFFISTGLIGKAGFLGAPQIAELSARGHTVGAHGVTHVGKMNRMADEHLLREWTESVRALAEIINAPVVTASVPSGFYSRRVARAAAAAGLRQLFTQVPTTRRAEVYGCEVLGRFTIRAWTPPSRVSALTRGALRPRIAAALSWRTRQLVKMVAGSAYGELRRAVLQRRSSTISVRS
ncbi:MAG TPA: polysaccharide deacetylase family protein [Bryobacteraceae bacterium]|nr:polysaccharide deacetylase family protein [Bryobacteraceae bacterium]